MIKYSVFVGVVALAVATSVLAAPQEDKPAEKHKRQIFREQVLPHSGGKIPSSAFHADRLALNRLNKDGISVPDGVLLDARRHDKHPHARHNSDLEDAVIKLVLTPDGRYTPQEGRYHDENVRTVDSTYVIRQPIGTFKNSYFGRYPKHKAYPPIPSKLELPAKQSKTPSFNRIPKTFGFRPSAHFGSHSSSNFGSHSSSNFGQQHYPTLYPDYFNSFYSPPTFSSFQSYFADFNNGRFARQSDWQPVRFPSEESSRSNASPKSFPSEDSSRSNASPMRFPSEDSAGPKASPMRFPSEDNARPNASPKSYPRVDDYFVCSSHSEERRFADVKTRCRGFHVCRQDGRRDVFYCPQETLFNEALQRCDLKNNVVCT